MLRKSKFITFWKFNEFLYKKSKICITHRKICDIKRFPLRLIFYLKNFKFETNLKLKKISKKKFRNDERSSNPGLYWFGHRVPELLHLWSKFPHVIS